MKKDYIKPIIACSAFGLLAFLDLQSQPVLPPAVNTVVSVDTNGLVVNPTDFAAKNTRLSYGSMDCSGSDYSMNVSGGVLVFNSYTRSTSEGVTANAGSGLFTCTTPGWYQILFTGTIKGAENYVMEVVTNNIGTGIVCEAEPNTKKMPVALSGVRYLTTGNTCGVSVTYLPGNSTVTVIFRDAQFTVTRLR